MQDEERFDRSFRGLAWNVWRALSAHHPQEFPPALPADKGIQLGCNFIAWFNDIQAIIEAMHRAHEQDILGNSKPRNRRRRDNAVTSDGTVGGNLPGTVREVWMDG
jgi:hypothetical protein